VGRNGLLSIRLHGASLVATTDNSKAANHPPSTSFLFCFFRVFFRSCFFYGFKTVAFDVEHTEKLKVNATVQYEVLTVISFQFYL